MSTNIAPIRVLIADDFQLLREDLNETISAQLDMEVVGMAENGQKTVQLAKETDFDIVIIDIEMESMNAGIKAAEKILEFKPDARILFLTAHETD